MASEEYRTSANVVRLRIKRFRGIEYLDWQPVDGINAIVGPADSAKSTVLEALALVLSPAPSTPLSEFDYFCRDTAATFSIEAVVGIGDGSVLGDGFPLPPMRGWRDGELRDLPDEDGAEPVLVCRIVGSEDCEAVYHVIGAGEEHYTLSRALRQRLGLVRLGVGERGDRDLRLVQGGALDRFLDARSLRRTVAQTVSRTPIHEQLDEAPAKALQEIEKRFKGGQLPFPVRLGLVGTPGVSLAASVGLTIGTDDDSALPLASWGNGTKRLAALEIAGMGIADHAIAVFDEPETGLEPYRQRAFVGEIGGSKKRQIFITTHAPAVLSACLEAGATVWRMRVGNSGVAGNEKQTTDETDPSTAERSADPESHSLLALRGDEAATLATAQSEVLVARLPVVCEGVTEVGFATALFRSRFGDSFQRRGVFCLDTGGHYKAVAVCRQLVDMGFNVAAVADDEGKKRGVWAALESQAIVLRWSEGQCLEKAIFGALPDELLREIPKWAEAVVGRDAKHQVADIRRALSIEKDAAKTVAELFEAVGRERFLGAVCNAACPRPKGNSKPRGWFKSFEGGCLLAEKMLAVSPAPALMTQVDAFLDHIDSATT